MRPFRRSDAAEFTRLAGDWAVASMTSDIPHPLSQSQAYAWLRPGRGEVRFAIELDGQLIGGAGYYRRRSGAAELGFWLGRPWWGRGYATEATQAIVHYGFQTRRLPGFTSSHFVDNWASAGSAAQARLRAGRPGHHRQRRPRPRCGGRHLLAERTACHADAAAARHRAPFDAALARVAEPARRLAGSKFVYPQSVDHRTAEAQRPHVRSWANK